MTRVMAIGFDAAEWLYVRGQIDAGALPRLAELRARSVECRLSDPLAFRHGLVFQQLIYGQSARLDTSWDHTAFDPVAYRSHQENASKHAHRTPFWERDPSLRTIVFDVPGLTVGRGPNSTEIVAWGSDSAMHPRLSRPAGLLRQIDQTIGPHPLYDNAYECGWHNTERIETMVAGAEEGARRRVAACRALMRRFPDWELFLTVISETHIVNEYLWHGVDHDHPLAATMDSHQVAEQMARVYRAEDEAIGQILDALPEETTIVVFSPYGCTTGGGDSPSIVLLPELLHRQHTGFANIVDGDQAIWRVAGYPPVVPRVDESWADWIERNWIGPKPEASAAPSLRARLRASRADPVVALRMALGRLSRPRAGAFGLPIPRESRLRRDDFAKQLDHALDWQVASWYRRWWPEMRAFALPSFSDGLVRVNLAGRESRGTVALGEYEAELDHVEATVRACRNPRTGQSVVADVVRYRAGQDPLDPDGPYADLGIRWSGPVDASEHPDLGFIGPVPFHRVATHSANGFMMISGPGIERSNEADRPSIDLPATILALTGRSTEALEGEPVRLLVGGLRDR